MTESMINVDVAYALPDRQKVVSLRVPRGTTMLDAALQSGIDEDFTGLDLGKAPMGIYGKTETDPRGRVLNDGERVEIYRPLIIDPKESRKLRARKSRKDA